MYPFVIYIVFDTEKYLKGDDQNLIDNLFMKPATKEN